MCEMPYEEISFSAYFYTEEYICQHQDAISLIRIGFPQQNKKKFFL